MPPRVRGDRQHAKAYAVGACRLVLLFVLALRAVPAAAQVSLAVDPARLDNGSVVDFPSPSCEHVAALPDSVAKLPDKFQTIAAEPYTLFVGSDAQYMNAGFFRYVVYVRVASPGAEESVFFCNLKAKQKGPFPDQFAELHFHVTQYGSTSDVPVTFPLYNGLADVQYLRATIPYAAGQSYVRVNSGSKKDFEIDVESLLPTMPVTLVGATFGNELREAWTLRDVQIGEERVARRGRRATLVVTLKTEGWKALQTTFVPWNPDSSHQRLPITLTYKTPGGITQDMRIELPIRLSPSILVLLAAFIIGPFVGCLIPRLMKLGGDLKDWRRALILTYVVTGVAWMIMVVAWQTKNRVFVFGFDLNPLEVIPLMVLGVVVGLTRFGSLNTVLGWLKNKTGNES